MPELPEVETTAGDLRPHLLGQYIRSVHVLWPRTVAEPDVAGFESGLAGRQVQSVARRGKYVVVQLDGGLALLCHLRMTGRLRVEPPGSPVVEDRHVRAWMELGDGRRLVFKDARKFGRLWLVRYPAAMLEKLGLEPLEPAFTAAALGERLRGRRTGLKALLLNQTVVAGLGNIYADEVLFRACIHPLQPAAGLDEDEVQRLHRAIVDVLQEAVRGRGTTLRDYVPPLSERGEYQDELQVYQRTGQPCPRCGEPIARIRVAQRSTHFCAHCQSSLSHKV